MTKKLMVKRANCPPDHLRGPYESTGGSRGTLVESAGSGYRSNTTPLPHESRKTAEEQNMIRALFVRARDFSSKESLLNHFRRDKEVT